MNQNNNLYFIKILERTFSSSDLKQSLNKAFKEIAGKGTLPEYEEGFNNFQMFIKAIDKHLSGDPELVERFKIDQWKSKMLDLITGTFKGSGDEKLELIGFIQTNPELFSSYEQIREELKKFLPKVFPIQIEIEKDGEMLGKHEFDRDTANITIKNISTGFYRVLLSTGRLLWEGNLPEEKLLWVKAYPQQKLPVAAETEPLKQRPTLTESLITDEIVLEVYPGIESGIILLKLRIEL